MSDNTISREGKRFVAVCKSGDVVSRQGTAVLVDAITEIALFRIEGSCFAVTNICPHQHHAVIAQGVVENDTVVCPMHGWQFNIRSGEEVTHLGRIRTFQTFEENGIVYVEDCTDELPNWMKEPD